MSEDARDLTGMLDAIGRGDRQAAEDLLPLVYAELRKLARQRIAREGSGQTLQPTELVHEAYLRLVGDESARWENRAHFFAAAAIAMRRILVERARRRGRLKRGGGRTLVTLDEGSAPSADPAQEIDLLALDEALDRLARHDRRMSEIVMLRYFAGLDADETALALGISPRTVSREWRFAKAWLHKAIMGSGT